MNRQTVVNDYVGRFQNVMTTYYTVLTLPSSMSLHCCLNYNWCCVDTIALAFFHAIISKLFINQRRVDFKHENVYFNCKIECLNQKRPNVEKYLETYPFHIKIHDFLEVGQITIQVTDIRQRITRIAIVCLNHK